MPTDLTYDQYLQKYQPKTLKIDQKSTKSWGNGKQKIFSDFLRHRSCTRTERTNESNDHPLRFLGKTVQKIRAVKVGSFANYLSKISAAHEEVLDYYHREVIHKVMQPEKHRDSRLFGELWSCNWFIRSPICVWEQIHLKSFFCSMKNHFKTIYHEIGDVNDVTEISRLE